jgi:hypothetical protein
MLSNKTITIPGGTTRPPDKPPGKGKGNGKPPKKGTSSKSK